MKIDGASILVHAGQMGCSGGSLSIFVMREDAEGPPKKACVVRLLRCEDGEPCALDHRRERVRMPFKISMPRMCLKSRGDQVVACFVPDGPTGQEEEDEEGGEDHPTLSLEGVMNVNLRTC